MSEPNVCNVARYIVQKLGSMTSMKLQKLVYYCQAWSLAWVGIPLFPEEFEAWENGTVCYELWEKHSDLFIVDEQFLSDYSYNQLNECQLETINTVLDAYSTETPLQLSSRVKSERPWVETRAKMIEEGASFEMVIDKAIMQEYYASKILVNENDNETD